MNFPLVSLSEVCEINIGKTPARANSEYWGKGYPWLSIADMKQGIRISATKEEITDLGVKESNIKLVYAGTVLFSFKLSIGKIGVAQRDLYTNEAIAALPIIDKTKLCEEYLIYALARMDASKTTDRAVMGATLNKKKLADLKIPLPPLEEQKRIAAILDKADAIRKKRKQAIELTEQFLRSTFLDMFGDPITNPKGWPTVKSSELFLVSPKIGTTTPAAGKGYLVVRVGEVGHARINYKQCGRVELSDKDFEKFRLKSGDTVIARAIGSKKQLGKASLFSGFCEPVVIDSHIMRFRPDPTKCDGTWFYSMISSDRGKLLLQQAGGATAVQFNINAQQASSLLIPIPPTELQETFANLVRKAYQMQETSKVSVEKMTAQFNGLAQRAFQNEL